MRALIQRVSKASVSIDGELKAGIQHGFLILFGIGKEDGPEDVEYLAKKISGLRVFEDDEGKMNLSLSQVGGEILLVSQFTLYADTRRGNRPGFSNAAGPDLAIPLYEAMISKLKTYDIPVSTGEFGADMQISLINDGPVTILIDSSDKKK
jgi:D-tyrosyl-tRNA(Tyr) deacylase